VRQKHASRLVSSKPTFASIWRLAAMYDVAFEDHYRTIVPKVHRPCTLRLRFCDPTLGLLV
jgi:hypothetical protein